MSIKQKLTAAAALGSLAASAFAPVSAFAANNVKVNNNGRGSENTVRIKDKKKTKVSQYNSTIVGTFVGLFSNTGGNKANDNGGSGAVDLDTGNVTNNVTITVDGGSNTATLPDCGCDEENNDVTVNGNRRNSTNTVRISSKSKTVVEQGNETVVESAIVTGSNTGDNQANDNNGGGEKSINTGNVSNTVGITVTGSTNEL